MYISILKIIRTRFSFNKEVRERERMRGILFVFLNDGQKKIFFLYHYWYLRQRMDGWGEMSAVAARKESSFSISNLAFWSAKETN